MNQASRARIAARYIEDAFNGSYFHGLGALEMSSKKSSYKMKKRFAS